MELGLNKNPILELENAKSQKKGEEAETDSGPN